MNVSRKEIPLPEGGDSTSLRNVGVNTTRQYVRNLDLKNHTNLQILAKWRIRVITTDCHWNVKQRRTGGVAIKTHTHTHTHTPYVHKSNICYSYKSWENITKNALLINLSQYCFHKRVSVAKTPCKQRITVRSRVQKFPAWHTKAAPNGKCCEGYIVLSMVRLMYQLKSVLK